MHITFHFGAAGHPVSWILYAVYGSGYGVALNAARTWHARMRAAQRSETPPGGQFVIEVKELQVVRTELLFDAAYFQRNQEPDDLSWLCQFQGFPLPIPQEVQDIVTHELRQKLIDIGFLIPRTQWERSYPEHAEMSRQFHAALRRQRTSSTSDQKDVP